jgi:hypothetical protein
MDESEKILNEMNKVMDKIFLLKEYHDWGHLVIKEDTDETIKKAHNKLQQTKEWKHYTNLYTKYVNECKKNGF